MKTIPIIRVPKNFCIVVVSSIRDESGRVELQFVNQGGVPHQQIIDLEDLPMNLDKIGLVIYIDKTEENPEILLPQEGRIILNFFEILNQYKESFLGKPAIEVEFDEKIKTGILKVRNLSQSSSIREIIESVICHLREMYRIIVPITNL
jgi:hypothetical protein